MTREIRRIVLEKGSRKPRLVHTPAPSHGAEHAKLRTILVGLDGTDDEVIQKADPDAVPPAADSIVLGHECLAEVIEAPAGSELSPGDRVVPLVRHGCARCRRCADGEADMCETGLYTEHGIKQLDGFLRDEWADDPQALVKVPRTLGDEAVLAEPLSIVLKAIEVIERIQRRVPGFEGFHDRRVLLAGTGSLGSLAALELVHAGARVWAYDRSGEGAASSKLLRALGAQHVSAKEQGLRELGESAGGFDVVIEATGSPKVAFEAALAMRENAITCLLGVPPEKPPIPIDADDVMRALVLKNQCIVGSVNSNKRHFGKALERLMHHRTARPKELGALITHTFSPEEATEAFETSGDDVIKKVVDWRR